MKRIWILLLALLLVLSTTACKGLYQSLDAIYGQDAQGAATEAPNGYTAEPVYVTYTPTYATAEPMYATDSPVYVTDAPVYVTDAPMQSVPSDGETLIMENADCLFKVTGYTSDSYYCFQIKVYLENKSATKTYRYTLDDVTVNGLIVSASLYQDVLPGKKATCTVNFSASSMEEYGITSFTDIGLYYRVYNVDDFSGPDRVEGVTHVYPYGIDKAIRYARTPLSADLVLSDTAAATVTAIGYQWDDIYGYCLYLYITNKTDKNISVTARDVTINGFMQSNAYMGTVRPNASKYAMIHWSLDDSGITNVTELEFTLDISDADDYYADPLVHQSVKLTA